MANNEKKVGQVWSYNNPKGEEKSTLVVVHIDYFPNAGAVVHISLLGLAVKNPQAPGGLSDSIQHLPMSREAMDSSVTKLLSTSNALPEFRHGYGDWRRAFDKGDA